MRARQGMAALTDEPAADKQEAMLARFDDSKHAVQKFEPFFWCGCDVELVPIHQ